MPKFIISGELRVHFRVETEADNQEAAERHAADLICAAATKSLPRDNAWTPLTDPRPPQDALNYGKITDLSELKSIVPICVDAESKEEQPKVIFNMNAFSKLPTEQLGEIIKKLEQKKE